MFVSVKVKKTSVLALLLVLVLTAAALVLLPEALPAAAEPKETDFIKWVDFDVPASLMKRAMEIDIETYDSSAHTSWVEILAYLGAEYGGDFSKYKKSDLESLLKKVKDGETVASIGKDMRYYDYYKEAYAAVLNGFVGEYEIETEAGWEKQYGLKAYSPIAKTFPYDDYDDFGASRTYGYDRKHLGHDMLAAVGTPVVAVESGVVEVMGWNQYGGWRIGIRSFDGMRYHYYAHLRQNKPFAEGLTEGQTVMAGDVIGYVGRTGYSAEENTNNIETSHLHYGLQLIFDESQKEGSNEIWIDVYEICNLLRGNQTETVRNDVTKERTRVQNFREVIPEDCFTPSKGSGDS